MGKTSKGRCAKQWDRGQYLPKSVTMPSSIYCAVWNCNGLIRDNKQDMIVDVMNDNKIHVLGVSETHLRQGLNDDLACLDKLTTILLYFRSIYQLDKYSGVQLIQDD